jgi:hypothetical protein
MERLRDQRNAADATVARAARLLSARAPLADDPMRQARVRARLRPRRRRSPAVALMRVALLVAIVCSVAVASATIGRVVEAIRAKLRPAPAATKESQPPSHRRHASHAAAPVVAAPAAIEAAAPAVVEAAAPSIVAAAPVAAPPASVAAPAVAPRAAARVVETEEQRLLIAAVRALRHDHDRARAAELLGRYVDRYPDGIATEDALALGLEATLGRDPARAAAFARRYLARHPAGRWSALARSALP